MSRRRFATLILLVQFALACGPAAPEAPPEAPEALAARARAIHERVLTIDTHDDIGFDFATPAVDPLSADRQVTLEKMRAGGLDVAFFIVYVGQGARTPEGYAQAKSSAMTKFDAIHRMAAEMYPDQIELALSAADVERIAGAGKLVAAIGIENGWVIGKDLSLLETYHRLGTRYMTLAHSGHNDIADSSTPRPSLGEPPEEHDGLSVFGEEVVAEMNRLGMMVDVSHISHDASLDAMRVSRAPVIASHSSTSALADVPRNMNDSALVALARNGGVVQVVAFGSYVKVRPEYDGALASLRQDLGIQGGGAAALQGLSAQQQVTYQRLQADLARQYPRATVADFVDHIDHAVQLIGIDHVGISSDFDGGGGVTGWDDASETFNVTLELVRRGYTEEDVRKLWGGNLMRVWREVEQVAAEMQAGGGA
jgi:membrane dipeptidase